MSVAERLFAWTPFRIGAENGGLHVDWCHLGRLRLLEPFFFETILHAMREPFNLAFQQRTPIDALGELPPGLPIAGFVFHMSRCGSTLVSQALAAFESNIVVAEAVPIRSVLRALATGRATPAQAETWLKGLVNAFAQPRYSYEARLVVKLMGADVLDIALFRRVFPDVPWIFLTRDPAEILASHAAAGSIDLMRGQIPPARLGLAESDVWSMPDNVYQAHALAAFAAAAQAAHAGGSGLILDYAELPDALWTRVLPHLGLVPNAGAIEVMRDVGRRHSKRPDVPFSPAHDPNRANAPAFRPIAEPIVGPVMAALAALRAA